MRKKEEVPFEAADFIVDFLAGVWESTTTLPAFPYLVRFYLIITLSSRSKLMNTRLRNRSRPPQESDAGANSAGRLERPFAARIHLERDDEV
jgi:hypothetical protein